MMKLWQRRALGILAVGGGAVGVTTLFRATRVIEWLIYIAFSCLYAWGVWCGVKLLEGQPHAEKYNRRFWLIQVPALNSPLLGTRCSAAFT